MADTSAVRLTLHRVHPADLITRAGRAVLDVLPFHAMVAFGAWSTGLWQQLADGPTGDLVVGRAQLAAVALVVGLVVLSAIQMISPTAPGQQAFGRVCRRRPFPARHRAGPSRGPGGRS